MLMNKIVVSNHENSKDIRRCCTPLVVLQKQSDRKSDLQCLCAVVRTWAFIVRWLEVESWARLRA